MRLTSSLDSRNMKKLKPRDVIRAAYIYCGKLIEDFADTSSPHIEMDVKIQPEDDEWVETCWKSALQELAAKLKKKGTPRRQPLHDRNFRRDRDPA